MSLFHQSGMHVGGAVVALSNGVPSVVAFTPLADEWTDIYVVHIGTNDTAVQTLTVTDGTTTLTYYVGGGATSNPPLFDQAPIPVRFKKGGAITVAANAVTNTKGTQVILRFLNGKT